MQKDDLILKGLDDLIDEIKQTQKSVDNLHKKLFEGNGQPSIVSTVQNNAFKLRIICWCVGVIYTGVITGIIAVIVKKL